MARWDNNTDLNSTLKASAFNRVLNRQAIDIARTKRGFLDMVLGRKGPADYRGLPTFERMTVVEGLYQELRLLGSYPTWTPTGNSFAAQSAVVTPDYDATKYGAAKFYLTTWTKVAHVPYWDNRRVGGEQQKGEEFLAEELKALMEGWEAALNLQMNANNDQTDTTNGGWPYAVSASNSYLGIDRSLAENANFRGRSTSGASFSTTGPDKVYAAVREVFARNGSPDFGVLSTTDYGYLMESLNNVYTVNLDAEKSDETGPTYAHVRIGPVKMVMEPDATAGTGLVGDSSTWMFLVEKDGFTMGDFMPDPGHVALLVAKCHVATALVCKAPAKNCLLTSVAT